MKKTLINRIGEIFKKPHSNEVSLEHELAELDKLTESLFKSNMDQIEHYRELLNSSR